MRLLTWSSPHVLSTPVIFPSVLSNYDQASIHRVLEQSAAWFRVCSPQLAVLMTATDEDESVWNMVMKFWDIIKWKGSGAPTLRDITPQAHNGSRSVFIKLVMYVNIEWLVELGCSRKSERRLNQEGHGVPQIGVAEWKYHLNFGRKSCSILINPISVTA